MCFSATASFSAAIVLLLSHCCAHKYITSYQQRMFALIPLLFALQQLFEGIIWVTNARPDFGLLHTVSTYGFLFFAFVVWPTWIPISLWFLEQDQLRKRLLQVLIGLGVLISSYLSVSLCMYGAVARVLCCHVYYDVQVLFPDYSHFHALIYALPTIGSFFITSSNKMHIFGLTLLGSFLAAAYVYQVWFISVWCFFAALLSILVICGLKR